MVIASTPFAADGQHLSFPANLMGPLPHGFKIEYVERKIFWMVFTVLGLFAYFLPLWWALAATIPIGILSWWIAYWSEWF
jgi:hypothetical protein